MVLSPHFTLAEFERSYTADKNGINNSMPKELIPNLEHLCLTILEPLRDHFTRLPPEQGGVTRIRIGSGYRCPKLNRKVGGTAHSQHMTGEAADLILPRGSDGYSDPVKAELWMQWLQANTDFDQLILETANHREYWIHVSCRRDSTRNRHQVLRLTKATNQ